MTTLNSLKSRELVKNLLVHYDVHNIIIYAMTD